MKYKQKSYSYILITVLFALFWSSGLSAQSNGTTITGVITAKIDGEPLMAATVAEKDENNRIIKSGISDFNGNYSIKVSDTNNSVTFSYIGYKTVTIVPGNRKVINVELVDEASALDVVEIRGTKKVFTGEFDIDAKRIATAVSTISTKEISETSPANIMDQLQGRISGLDIASTSGDVGAGMSIRIRGTSSLNASSEPLIVINGIPFETEIDELFDFGSADQDQYAAMIGVSADDIEEISVLKDAAATAQYGSRAANGVLLIKTKRGAKGKAQFSYSYRTSLGWQPKGIPMLNGEQYSTLIKEALQVNENTQQLDVPEIEFDPSYENYELYNNNTDWLDEITQLSTKHEHFLSVSGGGEKSSYRISATYKDQVGTTVGNSFKNFSTRAILDYKISDKISIATELSYTNGSLFNPNLSYNPYKNLRQTALLKMPNMSVYELDENGNPTDVYFSPQDNFQGSATEYYNPVAMANLAKNNIENNRIIPTFRFRYKHSKSLKYDAYINFDINTDKSSEFLPEAAIGTTWTSGNANQATFRDAEFFVIRSRNTLTWTPQFENKDHSLFSLIAFETFEKTSQGYEVSASNTPSSSIQTPIANTRIEGSGNSLESSFTKYASLSYNFSFNYAYKDRYILSGGVRSEGNSKFGDNYRYGVFPSIAAKWIISDEPFMEDIDFIDQLGLRASYGENGNSPNFNYGQYSSYNTVNDNYLNERPVVPSSVELTDLRWETVIQKNLGLTYAFFNYRLTGDIEYYISETRDFLDKNAQIPTSSGFSVLPFVNLGDLENRGFEFSLNAEVIKNKDFGLDINFNIARNENTVKRVAENQITEAGSATDTGEEGYLKRIQEGNSVGSFYGYRYLGVYSTTEDLVARDANGAPILDLDGQPKNMVFNNNTAFAAGDAKYEDINNDGRINELDVVYIGNANPLLYGGFGATLRYKNWQFIPFFNFRMKQKVINIARMNTESQDTYNNQSTAVLRRWRFEGQETDIPRADFGSAVNALGSDRFLEDASFVRLKNITLRYNFPKSITEKLKLTKAMLFVTGTNLITFTKYSGPDPEAGIGGNWDEIGYDDSQTPRAKQITAGLNISF